MTQPTMPTVSQREEARVRLQPLITVETAERLRVYSVITRKTQGEIIDDLVSKHLPVVSVPAADLNQAI